MIRILINQVITIFLLMSVGYLLFRGKKISQEGSKTLGNILILIFLPCVIIKSFMIERTPEMEKAIFLSAAAAFLSLLLTVVISAAFFRKEVAEMNTPLAMFSVGVYIAQVNVPEMLRKGKLYLISAVKLLLVPAAVLILLKFVMPQGFTDLKLAILIASAYPVGSNIAVYAQLYDRDYRYAVETVVISTILSIITIPFLVNMGLRVFS